MHSITEPIQFGFDAPKLCECGCGQPAPIQRRSNLRQGLVKGQPARFIKGHYRLANTRQALYDRLDRSGGPDACWIWTGSRDGKNYGLAAWKGCGERYAHRLSYRLHNGPIPGGLCVLHRCDNPPCCNPTHLFLGTKGDNNADMVAKGRQARGTMFSHTRMTQEIADYIRKRYAAGGISQGKIAKELGFGQSHISRVLRHEVW